MTGVSWRPPAPAGWASAAPAVRWRGGGAREGGRALGGRRPSGWGGEAAPGQGHGYPGAMAGRAFFRRLPAGWQTAPGQWRRPVMSRRSLRKLLFTSGPKLLTLGQILWHYAERAFHELSYVCFGFILAIMGIALDRSKWRSVISPKVAIIF